MQEAGADQYESEHKTFNHTRYENAQNCHTRGESEHSHTIHENGHRT